MQQRTEIIPYKRVESKDKYDIKKNIVIDREHLKYAIIFICSFLISRVNFIRDLKFNAAAIGVLLASIMINRKRENFSVLIGSMTGYLTLAIHNIGDIPIYASILLILFLCNKVINFKNNIVKIFVNLIYIIAAMLPYNIFFKGWHITYSLLNIGLNIITIIPICVIAYFAFYHIENKRNLTFLKSENVLIISSLAGLLVLGIDNFKVYGVNLSNVFSLSFILIYGFMSNLSMASLYGIVSGAIIGINESFIIYSGFYGIIGTIVSELKNISKYIVAMIFLLGVFFINPMSQETINITFIEATVAACIFILTPFSYIRSVFNNKKSVKANGLMEDAYINELKYFYMSKIDNFSNVFKSMNKTILRMNKSLEDGGIKTDEQIIQQIIENRCRCCSLRNACWKKNLSMMYNIFKDILESYREGLDVSRDELERKCIDYNNLINDFEKILSNSINYNIWNKRLNDNRAILADQMMNMSDSLEVMMEELDEGIVFRKDIENILKTRFSENKIEYINVICTDNHKSRIKINVILDNDSKILKNKNSLNFIINEATKNNFYLSKQYEASDNNVILLFEESTRYHIISCVKSIAKDGEQLNGDSYLCEKLGNDRMVTIISDGVGSGKNAMIESKASVDIMENYLKSGFNSLTALTMINSIMSINFSQNEMFSTIDLATIDLYTGEMEIAKMGAAPTFIKNGSSVEFIHSKSLPMGVIDKIDVDIVKKNVHNGDMIIMISDGAMSDLDGKGNYSWLCSFLKKSITADPQNLCNEIVDKIVEINDGKIKDDITVIVEKAYKIF